ncbi:MAG TPA: S1/P1 nuclease [Polyangia bacterium]|nr:S1/P1 nuclease [Polyangia bacterium]
MRRHQGGKRRFVGALLVAATLTAPRAARAWDDFGHMEVAATAFKALTPRTRTRVAALLKLNPAYANWIVGAKAADRERAAFMRAATWADSIKSDPRYVSDAQTAPTAGQNIGYADLSRHAYWHFVDQPFSTDGTPLVRAPAPNAATQIPILRAALAADATSDDVKSYDLVWLLHLVGDVHQPLHCVSRYDKSAPAGDRGGNDVKIAGDAQPPVCDDPRYCPFGPPNELHAFFDDVTGSGYATAPVVDAAAKLAAAPAKTAAVRDEEVWIAEGLDLAKTQIYVAPIGAGAGPFTVTPAYQAAAEALGKQRIALAGARLANLLDDALGK